MTDDILSISARSLPARLTAAERKLGRPTKRTPELVQALLESIESGEMLAEFCRRHDVHRATVHRWLAEDEGLSRQVTRAREVGDSAREDLYLAIAFATTEHEDDVQHRRLMLHAIEQRLRWSNPAKYGTKVGIGGAEGLPAVQAGASPTDVAARIEAVLAAARARRQSVEQAEQGGAQASQGALDDGG